MHLLSTGNGVHKVNFLLLQPMLSINAVQRFPPKKHEVQSDSSLTRSSGHHDLIPLDLFHFGPSDHIIKRELMMRSPEGQKGLRRFALITGSANFEV